MDWAQTALSIERPYGGGEGTPAEIQPVDNYTVARHAAGDDPAASWFWAAQDHLSELHAPAVPRLGLVQSQSSASPVPLPQPQHYAGHLPAEDNNFFDDAWSSVAEGHDPFGASFSSGSGFSLSRPQAELLRGYGVHADTDRSPRNATGLWSAAATQTSPRSFGYGTPAGNGSSLWSPSSENPTSPDASEWSSSLVCIGAASGGAPMTNPTRSYSRSLSPLASLSSTTTTTPTVPSSRQDSSSSPRREQIIPADSWLSAFHDAKRRLAAYEQHGWLFTPLHPIVLSEQGLRALLSGVDDDDGVTMRSSTSTRLPPSVKRDIFLLHANTAMAYGAALMNEGPQVEHFFQIARTSVDNLLEVDDYAVAEALIALGYLRYGQNDYASLSYYVTMANAICERIGAQNSCISLKCMLAYIFDPTNSPAEKERALRRYNRALKELPCWEDDHNQFLLESDKEKPTSTTCTLGMVPDVTLKDMFSTMECARNIDKCITNILMLKEVFEWMKQESANGRGLGPQAMAMVLDQLQRLTAVIKDEIDRGQFLPPAYKLTALLSWLCYNAEHARYMGDMKEAMYWGEEFLNKVRTDDVAVCTLGMVNLCVWMMELYIQNNRPDMVHQLLQSAEGFFSRYPMCNQRVAKFRERYLKY